MKKRNVYIHIYGGKTLVYIYGYFENYRVEMFDGMKDGLVKVRATNKMGYDTLVIRHDVRKDIISEAIKALVRHKITGETEFEI